MQRWTIHLEGGPRRVNHAAVAIGDRIYSFGGYCTGEDFDTTRPMDVHVLDTVSLRWSKVMPPPNPDYLKFVPYQRYGHTAVAVGECAYIWGGRNDNKGACKILFSFNTVTNSWSRPAVTGDIPGARDGHSACVINGKMFIFGGYEEEIDRFTNDVHMLDFSTMNWVYINRKMLKGEPPRSRDFHTATPIGDIMYIFGGRSDEGGPIFTNNEMYLNLLHAFDTSTFTWTKPSNSTISPVGRRSHSSFVHNGQMYIFGGYNGLRNTHYKDIHRYDPVEKVWSVVKVKGSGPCARRRQCCCVIKSRVFLFGGTSPVACLQHQPVIAGTLPEDQVLMDHSDLHVLDFTSTLKTLCMLAVMEHKLDTTGLPKDIRWELAAMTTNNCITRPVNVYG
ncbi:kelch domain-containing protein 3-like [Liolophura sinensis]|uniref:kelch domain-containing protein 3-like n=1 Tax=Liolophura sinensis TaxID=3198878 RepID=UPI003158F3E9